MLSFQKDPSIKEKFLEELKQKRMSDVERLDVERLTVPGIPGWLLELENTIFKKIDRLQAIYWTENFISAIPVGVDTEKVNHIISIERMGRLIEIQHDNKKKYEAIKIHHKGNRHFLDYIFDKVISAIELVKKCHEAAVKSHACDWETAEQAAAEAEDAAGLEEFYIGRSSEKFRVGSVWNSAAGSARFAAASARLSIMQRKRISKITMDLSAECYVDSVDDSADLVWFLNDLCRIENEQIVLTREEIKYLSAHNAWKKEATSLLEALKNCK